MEGKYPGTSVFVMARGDICTTIGWGGVGDNHCSLCWIGVDFGNPSIEAILNSGVSITLNTV